LFESLCQPCGASEAPTPARAGLESALDSALERSERSEFSQTATCRRGLLQMQLHGAMGLIIATESMRLSESHDGDPDCQTVTPWQ
jgi:hypothetical protein